MIVFYSIVLVFVLLAAFTLWAYLSYEDKVQASVWEARRQLVSQGMTHNEFEVSHEAQIAWTLQLINTYPINNLHFTKVGISVMVGFQVDTYAVKTLISDLRNAGLCDLRCIPCDDGYTQISITL